ncbi:hypothetical protein KAR10_01865, partial [bacterium]|nr:hypothetical protein [bacterium]
LASLSVEHQRYRHSHFVPASMTELLICLHFFTAVRDLVVLMPLFITALVAARTDGSGPAIHQMLRRLRLSSFLNLYQTGPIADMLSVVACFSGSPPSKVAHQVAHGLVGPQVCGTFASEMVKQPPPSALHISRNFRSRMSRRMTSVIGAAYSAGTSAGVTGCKVPGVLQELDRLAGMVSCADGCPARADRIEGDRLVEVQRRHFQQW